MNASLRLAAAALLLALLAGCSTVTAPMEELDPQPASRPVEGVPADPQPVPPKKAAIFPEGAYAVLPGVGNAYTVYDNTGTVTAVFHPASGEKVVSGVYPGTAIVGGLRLSTGKPAVSGVETDAALRCDDTGASTYSPALRRLTRYDLDGLPVFSAAPAAEDPDAPTVAAILPFGSALLVSLWTGDGSAAAPWRQQAPCQIRSRDGITLYDLSTMLSTPVIGVLGGRYLLTARTDSPDLVDVYDLDGTLLEEGVMLLSSGDMGWGLTEVFGGVACDRVWKAGQVLTADLQPELALADAAGVTACGDYLSGVEYSISGISSNGQLCICGEDCAIWGLGNQTLAIQWQGVNYHFAAAKRAQERLQACNAQFALSYAWDADGSGCFRLLFLTSGNILEYNCAASQQIAATLGDGYALMMTADSGGTENVRYRVVDALGAMRWETATATVRPCVVGSLLLRQEGGITGITDLDGNWILTQASAQAPEQEATK